MGILKKWRQTKRQVEKYSFDKREYEVIEFIGREYDNFFYVKESYGYSTLYHIPLKKRINSYHKMTLAGIDTIVEGLLNSDIDWKNTNPEYFENLSLSKKSQINKIILNNWERKINV